MVQVIKRLLLIRKLWGTNPKPIKSHTRCQQPVTAASLIYGPWRKAAKMGTDHSIVIPKRYKRVNKDLTFFEKKNIYIASVSHTGTVRSLFQNSKQHVKSFMSLQVG